MITPEELETAKRLAKISTRVEFQLPFNGGVTSICGNVRSSFILAMVEEITALREEIKRIRELLDETRPMAEELIRTRGLLREAECIINERTDSIPGDTVWLEKCAEVLGADK